MAGKLLLCRHGQSDWNLKNLFTGWTDVDLTDQGIQEARDAGKLLSEMGYEFDIAFTSVLKRAIRTLWLMLDEMDQMWIPVVRDWRLNERHYGALQGLNKAETAAKYGDEQVHIWRRSYDIPPPALELSDERHPSHDPRYAGIDNLPATESLALTLERVFKRESPMQTARAILEEPIRRVDEVEPYLPAGLADIVAQALERDPERLRGPGPERPPDGLLARGELGDLAKDPSAGPLTVLGRIYEQQEDWTSARRIYRSMLLQNMDEKSGITKADVYYNLGLIHEQLGETKKAVNMFERGLEIKNDHAELQAALARVKG